MIGHWKVNNVVLAVGLVFLSVVATFTSAALCTPSTCPPGPVLVGFRSLNCSGTPFAYMPAGVRLNECNDGDVVFERGGALNTLMGSSFDICDYTRPDSSFSWTSYFYGVCTNGWYFNVGDKRSSAGSPVIDMTPQTRGLEKLLGLDQFQWISARMRQAKRDDGPISMMWLPGVNSSYFAPQPSFDDLPLPDFEQASARTQCPGVNNCKASDGSPAQSWSTSFDYTTNSCAIDANTASFNSPDLNWNKGSCYNNFHQVYVAPRCTDSHGYANAYYSQSSCLGIPQVASGHRSVCQGYYQASTSFCTATPMSFPAIPPPG